MNFQPTIGIFRLSVLFFLHVGVSEIVRTLRKQAKIGNCTAQDFTYIHQLTIFKKMSIIALSTQFSLNTTQINHVRSVFLVLVFDLLPFDVTFSPNED